MWSPILSLQFCWLTETNKHKYYINVLKYLSYLLCFFLCFFFSDRQTWANSLDPDQTPQNAASDLGLNCLTLIQQFQVHQNVIKCTTDRSKAVVQVLFVLCWAFVRNHVKSVSDTIAGVYTSITSAKMIIPYNSNFVIKKLQNLPNWVLWLFAAGLFRVFFFFFFFFFFFREERDAFLLVCNIVLSVLACLLFLLVSLVGCVLWQWVLPGHLLFYIIYSNIWASMIRNYKLSKYLG